MGADHEGRTVGMVPGRDLHGELVVVAHPDRYRIEKMHEVELVRLETFNNLRPAADERRRFRVEAFLFEEPHFMRDKQRGRVGDGQVAYAHHGIKFLFSPCVSPRHHAAERGERAHLEQRAAADAAPENRAETRVEIQR